MRSVSTPSCEFALRPIQPPECDQVVALLRAALPAKEVLRTIYASAHPERYLASLIAFPAMQREHVLQGVWQGDQLVGYVHLRSIEETLHLNYIAVLPAYQGCGIGRMLWAWWTGYAKELEYRAMSLDVSQENERALEWYRRKGFEITGKTWSYERALKRAGSRADYVTLRDWDSAEAWQSCYGFSQFRLVYQDETWVIGRLGKLYFRVSQQLPAAVETVLANMDPGRLLLVISAAQIQSSGFVEAGVSLRMCSHVA